MKIKKVMLSIVVVLFLSGCGNDETREFVDISHISIACIDGVEYIVTGYKLAPHFKRDGRLYLCKVNITYKRKDI